ncbi:MAG: type III effector [Moraxellaceae bacterium]|nr:MAG: type III effector [Moraxellaceae bacterium]
MTLEELLGQLKQSPLTVEFEDVMSVIRECYDYVATEFQNGNETNPAGSNEGSCKIFAFGKLHGLSEEQTLACFGGYYRDDVLMNPEGSDHGNIRNFMSTGWLGIHFGGEVLAEL